MKEEKIKALQANPEARCVARRAQDRDARLVAHAQLDSDYCLALPLTRAFRA